MATKKFYWLKLKRDFFKRHDIRIIEEMPNGKDYVLFYLKLLLESIDHEGSLRFSDAIPYNEQMLSVVTNTNIDIVKSAMKLFLELNMIDMYDDATIYMNEVANLIGSETNYAVQKRLQRAKTDDIKTISGQCLDNVQESKSKSKKKSIELEVDVDVSGDDNNGNDENVDNSVDNSKFDLLGGSLGKGVVLLTEEQFDALLDELGLDAFNHYIDKLATFIIEKNAKVSNHYATIRKWAKEDMKV